MNNKFKWWEAETFAFVRVPKAILSNPAYKELSANAALLYGILLDRMSLNLWELRINILTEKNHLTD